jgi:aldose 1-epimerase
MTASAQVLRLRSDELEVVILPEVGGRIHRIRAFGADLLRTPGDPATHALDPFFWGAYVMAPWCNRARPGPMEVAGRRIHLDANFPDGSAIHGLVAAVPWDRVNERELVIRRESGKGWPWAFEARQRVTLEGASIEAAYRLTNLEPDAPMPAGLGVHPWFRLPLELRIPAPRVNASNIDSPPQPAPVAGDFDMRSLGRSPIGLDATLTGLTEPRIELAWPDLGLRVRLEVETDPPGLRVAVATPADLDAAAVEPQTHGPDPLRRLEAGEPDAPALLAPGASLVLSVRLTVERDRRAPPAYR